MTPLDHVAAIVGGLTGVVLGYVDLRTGAHLTGALDGILITGGLGLLGFKGITGRPPL